MIYALQDDVNSLSLRKQTLILIQTFCVLCAHKAISNQNNARCNKCACTSQSQPLSQALGLKKKTVVKLSVGNTAFLANVLTLTLNCTLSVSRNKTIRDWL